MHSCYDNMAKNKFERFLEFLNGCHPTMRFANDLREEISFLDVVVKINGNKVVTGLNIKSTDRHQYLEASSSHVYHSKRFITYKRAPCLNRICSENSSYDKRCNELVV